MNRESFFQGQCKINMTIVFTYRIPFLFVPILAQLQIAAQWRSQIVPPTIAFSFELCEPIAKLMN